MKKAIDKFYWAIIVISIYPLFGMIYSLFSHLLSGHTWAMASDEREFVLSVYLMLISVFVALAIIGFVTKKHRVYPYFCVNSNFVFIIKVFVYGC